jgi:hypothetical protein
LELRAARFNGKYGVQAEFYRNERFFESRMFAPHLDPTRTPREMAIMWAEEERKAIERDEP